MFDQHEHLKYKILQGQQIKEVFNKTSYFVKNSRSFVVQKQ